MLYLDTFLEPCKAVLYCVIVSVELIFGKLVMYEFPICLHCDSLKQGKRGVNETEIRETSECLSFQAFLSVCFFSRIVFHLGYKSVCTMTHLSLSQPQTFPTKESEVLWRK